MDKQLHSYTELKKTKRNKPSCFDSQIRVLSRGRNRVKFSGSKGRLKCKTVDSQLRLLISREKANLVANGVMGFVFLNIFPTLTPPTHTFSEGKVGLLNRETGETPM